MKLKIHIALIILWHVCLQDSLAQGNEIKFNLVVGNNGQPLGQINSITQDPTGYMWFSGPHNDCIYRYDGIRMTAFKNDSLNDSSLGGLGLIQSYLRRTFPNVAERVFDRSDYAKSKGILFWEIK